MSDDLELASARFRQERDEAHALIQACHPYLKESETPRERMDRDFADNQSLLRMLAEERAKREALEAALQEAMWGKVWALEQVDRAAKEATDAQARALAATTALERLVYQDGKQWFAGVIGDSDVTDVVGDIFGQASGVPSIGSGRNLADATPNTPPEREQ